MDLLRTLIDESSKAACIARTIHQEKSLSELLVQEKSAEEKNQCVAQDFKTLADVLIQETIKYDVTKKFPSMKDHIFGEESNKFTNKLGESIIVQVKDTIEDTAQLLTKVLDGNTEAATLLATEVHKTMSPCSDPQLQQLQSTTLNYNDLAIWIDPIDSTDQYIHGQPCTDVLGKGLHCVTVLIGVFSRSSGKPVMGIVNQPFHVQDVDGSWQGKHYWGFTSPDLQVSNLPTTSTNDSTEPLTIATSSSEPQLITQTLAKKYKCITIPGAGYKLLSVALGIVNACLVSSARTYRWDSCAPQALLNSMGGAVLDFTQSLESSDLTSAAISYRDDDGGDESKGVDRWCNKGGVLAVRNLDVAKDIVGLVAGCLKS